MSKYEEKDDRDPRAKVGLRPVLSPFASMNIIEAMVCFDSMALALNNIDLEMIGSPKAAVVVAIFKRHEIETLRIELARMTLKRALGDRGILVP